MAVLHGSCFTTPRPWTPAEFESLLADPHVISQLVPGGFVIGRAVAGEAEILTIAVDPAMRRAGIGRSLLRLLEKAASIRGAERVFLEVSGENRAAIALYLAEGYAEAGRRPGYYRGESGMAVDALLMSKPLFPGQQA